MDLDNALVKRSINILTGVHAKVVILLVLHASVLRLTAQLVVRIISQGLSLALITTAACVKPQVSTSTESNASHALMGALPACHSTSALTAFLA